MGATTTAQGALQVCHRPREISLQVGVYCWLAYEAILADP
jgi:hypothetical protein